MKLIQFRNSFLLSAHTQHHLPLPYCLHIYLQELPEHIEKPSHWPWLIQQ